MSQQSRAGGAPAPRSWSDRAAVDVDGDKLETVSGPTGQSFPTRLIRPCR